MLNLQEKYQDLFAFIENQDFSINELEDSFEFETWTTGGVNMIYYIEKANFINDLKNLYSNFDIDEEIEIHRQGESYREAFTIRESLEDFEAFQEILKTISDEARKH